jgi:hypothetical protein
MWGGCGGGVEGQQCRELTGGIGTVGRWLEECAPVPTPPAIEGACDGDPRPLLRVCSSQEVDRAGMGEEVAPVLLSDY